MQISGTVSSLLHEKNPGIWSVESNWRVYDAIEFMAAQNVGALPVLEGGRLVGMLSERDYTRKVVLKGRSSKDTSVAEIMTRHLVVVRPEDTVAECMRLMTEERIRHLPVMQDEKLIGILSIGDLVKWIMSAQTATIDHLTKYVFGET